jgi:hypothetical protein
MRCEIVPGGRQPIELNDIWEERGGGGMMS